MRKNQKYSKDQMYSRIEAWQQSGLSRHQYCRGENLSISTFNYWLRKYKQENFPASGTDRKPVAFLPVEITHSKLVTERDKDFITITYPNGIRICCPISLD